MLFLLRHNYTPLGGATSYQDMIRKSGQHMTAGIKQDCVAKQHITCHAEACMAKIFRTLALTIKWHLTKPHCF